MRLLLCPDHPGIRRYTSHLSIQNVPQLCLGHVYQWLRSIAQRPLPHITYDANDLPHLSVFKHASALSDHNAIAKRVAVLPKLSGHSLIYNGDGHRLAVVPIRECASALYRNFEYIEVTP